MKPAPDPLESELARLRPRALPPNLRLRLVRARPSARKPFAFPFRRPVPVFCALAAAFLLAAIAWWSLPIAPPAGQPALVYEDDGEEPEIAPARPRFTQGMRPVRMEQRLANRIDDGVVLTEDQIGIQRFRYQFIDTVVWEDPTDGSFIEMKVPREEIVLVPIAAF